MIRSALLSIFLIASTAMAADKIRIGLNWVPEPEFGGIYQAREDGTFARNDLDVDITPGGAGAPTWQLVAAGKMDFAVASADEVITARAQKADVVTIFATYQTCPQAIMVHASRKLLSLSDLFKSKGKLAVEPGLAFVNFLQKKFAPSAVEMVTYDGGIASFLNDKLMAQQCFVTSEPIAAKRAGSDPQTFLVADSGYNPYTAVVITRGSYLRDHARTVDALVTSLQAGWNAYLADPAKANEAMAKLNPEMDLETFKAAGDAQKPLIATEETRLRGLGWMTLDRWKTLIQQLADLKVIDSSLDPQSCFVNPK